jgi:hypothetical protein
MAGSWELVDAAVVEMVIRKLLMVVVDSSSTGRIMLIPSYNLEDPWCSSGRMKCLGIILYVYSHLGRCLVPIWIPRRVFYSVLSSLFPLVQMLKSY